MQDPVLLVMKAAAGIGVVILVVVLGHVVHRDSAMANLHCPSPDHALWADSLGPSWLPPWLKGEAICGESVHFHLVPRAR